jgi:hypothetical protein
MVQKSMRIFLLALLLVSQATTYVAAKVPQKTAKEKIIKVLAHPATAITVSVAFCAVLLYLITRRPRTSNPYLRNFQNPPPPSRPYHPDATPQPSAPLASSNPQAPSSDTQTHHHYHQSPPPVIIQQPAPIIREVVRPAVFSSPVLVPVPTYAPPTPTVIVVPAAQPTPPQQTTTQSTPALLNAISELLKPSRPAQAHAQQTAKKIETSYDRY